MLSGPSNKARHGECSMRNMSQSISDRVIGEAVESYLERQEGLRIIDRGFGPIDFVCEEMGEASFVFVCCSASDGTSNSEEPLLHDAEAEMTRYLSESGCAAGTKARLDTVHVFVCGSKGILRHHVAAR